MIFFLSLGFLFFNQHSASAQEMNPNSETLVEGVEHSNIQEVEEAGITEKETVTQTEEQPTNEENELLTTTPETQTENSENPQILEKDIEQNNEEAKTVVEEKTENEESLDLITDDATENEESSDLITDDETKNEGEIDRTTDIVSKEEGSIETVSTKEMVKTTSTSKFKENTRYFTVSGKEIPVYHQNLSDPKKDILVGYLLPGSEYKIQRFSDGLNWIVVSFGAQNGYVRSGQVNPSAGSNFKNPVTNGKYKSGYVTNSKAAAYEKPSNQSRIYAYLQEGVNYSILGTYSNFFLIDVGGRITYFHKDNLNVPFTTKDQYFKTTKNISIYYQSSKGDYRVGTLLPKQEYKIRRFSDGTNWLVIDFGHKNAYIRAKDVQPSNGSNFKNPVVTSLKQTITTRSKAAAYKVAQSKTDIYAYLEPNITYQVLGRYYNYFIINIGGRQAYVHIDNTTAATAKSTVSSPKISTNPYVSSFNLKVYEDFEHLSDYRLNSTHSEYAKTYKPPIATLNYGQIVHVLGNYKYASKVKLSNGQIGWVHSAYLVGDLNKIDYFVKAPSKMYTNPGSSYMGTSVQQNEIVKVFTTYGKWAKVKRSNGQIGWINNDLYNGTGYTLIRYETNQKKLPTNDISVFTPLNSKSTVTSTMFDQYLLTKRSSGTSRMEGMGEVYIKAGQATGLNPIYIFAHSALETGWGTSDIVKEKNNFFGIQAKDGNISAAISYRSPEEGIIDGAKWISQEYTHRSQLNTTWAKHDQPTLDSMLNNNGEHEYASDKTWPYKIADIAQGFYSFIKQKFNVD